MTSVVDLSLASPRITSVGLVRPPGEAQLYGTSRGEGRVKISKFDRGCRCDTVDGRNPKQPPGMVKTL